MAHRIPHLVKLIFEKFTLLLAKKLKLKLGLTSKELELIVLLVN
jgi:hypothetical protein